MREVYMDEKWNELDFVRGVTLPQIDMPRGFHYQSYQSRDFMDYSIGVSHYGIQMSASDLERALRNPEQFIQSLQSASNAANAMYYGDVQNVPKRHIITPGLLAFDNDQIVRGGSRNKHVTILTEQRNAIGSVVSACTHYVELGAYFDAITKQDMILAESVANIIKQTASDEIKASVEITENNLQYLDKQMERVKDKERRLRYKQKVAERKIQKAAEIEGRAKNSNTGEIDTKGYVYLLQSVSGHYKIGRTSNPDNRLRTFNVKLPFEVEYVCLIQTPDMYALEATLHERFTDKRINGEWFNLNPEDVAYIQALAQEDTQP